jgi:hypothetical protein
MYKDNIKQSHAFDQNNFVFGNRKYSYNTLDSKDSYIGKECTRSSNGTGSDSHNIVYQPKTAVLCLSLRSTVGNKLDLLVRHAFNMIRRGYIEYLRCKSPSPWRRSHVSKDKFQDTPTQKVFVIDTGDLIIRKSRYHKKTTYKARSQTTSPNMNHNLNTKLQSTNSLDTANAIKSLTKVFHKSLRRRFMNFCEPDQQQKLSAKKIFGLMNSKLLSHGFKNLKDVNIKSSGNSEVIVGTPRSKMSISSTNSRSKRPSFEEKDKEIWRKRNLIRKNSPSPSEVSAASGPFSACNISETDSQRNIEYDNPFSIQKQPDITNLKGASSSFKAKSIEIDKDNFEDVPSGPYNHAKNKKNIAEHKPKALRSGKPDLNIELSIKKENNSETKKSLQKMINNIEKNHKKVKKQAFLNLTKALEAEKKLQKKMAANIMTDLLQVFIASSEKSLKNFAFNKIKTTPPAPQEKIIKSPSKKKALRSENTPRNFSPRPKSRKQALRSESNRNSPSPKPKSYNIELFIEKLSFSNQINLKNKLISFLSIVDNKEPDLSSKTSEKKTSLRNIFRIIETKIFSKLYNTFYAIKRSASKRIHSRSLKSLQFFQKLNKISISSTKKILTFGFNSLKSLKNKTKGLKKLKTQLKIVQNRLKLVSKPFGFFSIKSYSDKAKLNSMLKFVKADYLLKKIYIRKVAFAFM